MFPPRGYLLALGRDVRRERRIDKRVPRKTVSGRQYDLADKTGIHMRRVLRDHRQARLDNSSTGMTVHTLRRQTTTAGPMTEEDTGTLLEWRWQSWWWSSCIFGCLCTTSQSESLAQLHNGLHDHNQLNGDVRFSTTSEDP